MKIINWSAIIAVFVIGVAQGAVNPDVYDPAMQAHSKNIFTIEKQYRLDKEQFGKDDNFMVRMGLLASRSNQTVTVYADSTGLGTGETIEFYLIGDESSHSYEALLISFASPSDVRDALTFIGMEPGRAVDYDKLRFWPKGERVEITADSLSASNSFTSLPLSDFLLNYETHKSGLTNGFVFTGSKIVADESGKQVPSAELGDPHSIISDYNEYNSILDIPIRSIKGDAYGDNTVNTKHALAIGTMLRLTIRPEYTDGSKRVLNLQLNAICGNSATSDISDVSFALVDSGLKTTNRYENITALASALSSLVKQGKDPFVTLKFDHKLSLANCHKLAAAYDMMQSQGSIRIEPPLPGELLYKAFIPDEHLRKRENRYIQPLELHLKLLDGKLDATLIKVDEFWAPAAVTPVLTPKIYPVVLHGGLVDAIKDTEVKHDILLIFADADIQLGQLLDYIKPVRGTHRFIHIYL